MRIQLLFGFTPLVGRSLVLPSEYSQIDQRFDSGVLSLDYTALLQEFIPGCGGDHNSP